MTRRLRVGIVGASAEGQGWAPLSHFPALRALPDYEIAAICTAHAETAAAAARVYGVAHAYHDIDDMLRQSDLDLVSVVVRVPNHHDVVMAALRARKNVYCEWPLGATLAEAEAMAALARANGVHAMVGLQARGDPVINHLRELVADGYVGDVVAVNMSMFTGGILERPSSRLWDRDRTKGVSALTVRGIHSMDSLCYCLGDFVEVSARVLTQVKQWRVSDTGAMVDVDAADNVAVHGVLEGGALASVQVGTVPYNASGWRMEIYGRDGTLRIATKGAPQRDMSELLGSRNGQPLAALPIPARLTHVPPDTPAGPPRNVGELYLRMAHAIREGVPAQPDFDVAVERHRLIEAIERSSNDGRSVRLDQPG
ncbi:MAG TPA: Gfo/Idh/MocA family oxidoreductase [Casimicrobiaceae bacterium]